MDAASMQKEANLLWGDHGACARGPDYWCSSVANMRRCGMGRRQCPMLARTKDDLVAVPEGYTDTLSKVESIEIQKVVGAFQQDAKAVRAERAQAAFEAEAARSFAFKAVAQTKSQTMEQLAAVDAVDRKESLDGKAKALAIKEKEEKGVVEASATKELQTIKALGVARSPVLPVPTQHHAPTTKTATLQIESVGDAMPALATKEPLPAPIPMPTVITATPVNQTVECKEEARLRREQASELLDLAQNVVALKGRYDAAKALLKNMTDQYTLRKREILLHLSQASTSSVIAYEAHETKGAGVTSRLDQVQESAQLALKEQQTLVTLRARLMPLTVELDEKKADWVKAAKHLKKSADAQIKAAERKIALIAAKAVVAQSTLDHRMNESVTDARVARDMALDASTSLVKIEAALHAAILSAKAAENTQVLLQEILRRKDLSELALRAAKKSQGLVAFEPPKADGPDLLSDKEFNQLQTSVDAAAEAALAGRKARDDGPSPIDLDKT